jgi:DNA-binding response OmpR family regulator/DNA-binding CsgD family transcriptional regulator
MRAIGKLQPIKVLLVDDDRDDAALTQRMLSEAGPGGAFEVKHADRFSAAVRHLSREGTDVVLLALALPDAQEVGGVCGLCGLFPELPIVVLARLEDEVLGLSAIREGAQDYLVKGQVDRRLLARSLRHAIERKRGQREGVLATLDRFPVGVLLLNEEGRVFLSNRAAEEILAEGDGLSLEQGFLRTGSVQDTARIEEAIRRATQASSREPSLPVEGLSVPRQSLRRPLSLMVAPIRARDPQHTERRPSAVLFVSDPERRTLGTNALLTRLYGLSPAEARLAGELMQGHSLEASTTKLGISIHTGRSQLKRTLVKTDTRRQGELIRLLLAGPAPLR